MEFSAAYRELLKNPRNIFVVLPDGTIPKDSIRELQKGTVLHVYPGSFNPLHAAHRDIFDHIPFESKAFEISIARMGKENLDEESLRERLLQFRGYASVVVTNAARFLHKCAVLKPLNPYWHVGVDTIIRMRDDYGELGFEALPGQFSVYDREVDGVVQKYPLDFHILPKNVRRAAYQGQPLDMSSTKIRQNAKIGA